MFQKYFLKTVKFQYRNEECMRILNTANAILYGTHETIFKMLILNILYSIEFK